MILALTPILVFLRPSLKETLGRLCASFEQIRKEYRSIQHGIGYTPKGTTTSTHRRKYSSPELTEITQIIDLADRDHSVDTAKRNNIRMHGNILHSIFQYEQKRIICIKPKKIRG